MGDVTFRLAERFFWWWDPPIVTVQPLPGATHHIGQTTRVFESMSTLNSCRGPGNEHQIPLPLQANLLKANHDFRIEDQIVQYFMTPKTSDWHPTA